MDRQSTQQAINDLINAWASGYITDDELIEMTDLITGEVTTISGQDIYTGH